MPAAPGERLALEGNDARFSRAAANGSPTELLFVVRPADLDDLFPAIDLVEAVAQEGRWIGVEAPIDRDERLAYLRESLADDRRQIFVAVDEGRVIGLAWTSLAPYRVADLAMLVAAEWRRRGVGWALLEAAVGWARQVGAHKIALQVWPHNGPARGLYRKFGFAEEGVLPRHYRRRNGELWDAVVMGLVLDDSSPGSSL